MCKVTREGNLQDQDQGKADAPCLERNLANRQREMILMMATLRSQRSSWDEGRVYRKQEDKAEYKAHRQEVHHEGLEAR